MRGVAVLLAATAGWVVVAGSGTRQLALPRLDVRATLTSVVALGGVAMAGYGFLGVPAAALALGGIAACVPFVLASRSARAREAEERDRWPDVLMQVRSSVSAGSTLADAVVGAFVAADGRYRVMADVIRREVMFGGGFTAASIRIREEAQDPTTDRVLVSLAAANRSGGVRVGEVIGVLARSVGDEIRLRKAHEASITEQRLTINVALIAPWALLTLSIATNPQAQRAFSTAEGASVIAFGFAATVIGWIMALRTARLRTQTKVFR